MSTQDQTTITTNSGFVRSTDIGTDVTAGVKEKLSYKIVIKAKSQSMVMDRLSSYKGDFSAEQWKDIQSKSAGVGGGLGFFAALFSLGINGHFDTSSSSEHDNSHFTDNKIGKVVTDVLNDTDDQNIELSGTLEVEGTNVVIPTHAQVYTQIMQVQMTTSDKKTVSFKAISDSPKAIAADDNGDTSGVKSGPSDTKIKILPNSPSLLLDTSKVIKLF